MSLLKAYSNLDLRPSGVDSLGRLTTEDERDIIETFRKTYGPDTVNIPIRKIDYALSRTHRVKPFDLVVTVKSKEVPANLREDDPEAIVGCAIGTIADEGMINAISKFSMLKPTLSARPRMDKSLKKDPTLVITGFINRSRYANSSMIAFLMRKIQASTFGKIPMVLLWPSTKIDKRLNEQFVHYGFRPYGIGNLSSIPGATVIEGRCIAMWTPKPIDDRERK